MESIINDIIEDIEAIQEKLKTSMTEGQKADWQRLLDRRLTKLTKLQGKRSRYHGPPNKEAAAQE